MKHRAAADDTIVAIATPQGKGGIGIVRLSGPKARNIAESITAKSLQPRQVIFCSYYDGRNEVLDEGIVLYFQQPASYTGEEVVELQAHGSPVILRALLERAVELGARHARPGEFTERAFLNDKLDLLQAEAVADLIETGSLAAARQAARSLQGAFSTDVDEVLAAVIELRAFVEGALDFPEEEIDFLNDNRVSSKLGSCIDLVDRLLDRANRGRRLRAGKKIVIAGRPNVGKSSLMNCLSGFEAVIVSAESGTTRDLIEQEMIFAGVSAQVTDTAGLRTATDPVEKEGVSRARQAIEDADIVIYVREHQDEPSQEKEMEMLPDEAEVLCVFNKIDLAGCEPYLRHEPYIELGLSAKTGAGLNLLINELSSRIGAMDTTENILLARDRHIDAMNRARQSLAKGLQQLQTSGAGELLAEELRQAQDSLSELKGDYLPDDLLGEIFSRFCIGK